MLDLGVREIPPITFFGVSQKDVLNVCADLEDHFAKSKTMPGTKNSNYFVPITSQDRAFLQFDFDKSLTTKIDIKNKCFSYVSKILCIIIAPTTIAGQIYQISDTDFE